MGSLRLNVQRLEEHADLPPDPLALVLRRGVHIGGPIVWPVGGFSVVIQAEQVEFQLRTEGKMQPGLFRSRHRVKEDRTGIVFKSSSIRIGHKAAKLHELSLVRPPRQQRQAVRDGMEEQVGVYLAAKARDGGGVDGDAIGKRPFKLCGQNGDILLPPENVAKAQMNETHVLFPHKSLYVFSGVLHNHPSKNNLFALYRRSMKK